MSITVKGAIKQIGNPDFTCFESFAQLFEAFPKFFGVEIPGTITNVIVSNIEPTDTQRTAVWFRMSNGGTFIGIYLFSSGAWEQFFPVPFQVYRVVGGDSRTPPDGFILTDNSPLITSVEKAHLKVQWLKDPTDTFYTIFDVVPAPF